jgi:hypothetical protein
LRELAERELPPAGERFATGLRQTLRWEQRRRRGQRRRLLAIGCLTGLLAALAVALALPVTARYLPLPVGRELRRLDAQTIGLRAQLVAQAAADVRLRRQLAQTVLVDAAAARHAKARRRAPHPTGSSAGRTSSYGGWVWVGPGPTSSPGAGRPVVAPPLASAPGTPPPSASPTTQPSP